MSQVKVLSDTKHPHGGYAVLQVTGPGTAWNGGDLVVKIQHNASKQWLTTTGWDTAVRSLKVPARNIERNGRDLLVRLGPVVVNKLGYREAILVELPQLGVSTRLYMPVTLQPSTESTGGAGARPGPDDLEPIEDEPETGGADWPGQEAATTEAADSIKQDEGPQNEDHKEQESLWGSGGGSELTPPSPKLVGRGWLFWAMLGLVGIVVAVAVWFAMAFWGPRPPVPQPAPPVKEAPPLPQSPVQPPSSLPVTKNEIVERAISRWEDAVRQFGQPGSSGR